MGGGRASVREDCEGKKGDVDGKGRYRRDKLSRRVFLCVDNQIC